MNKQNWHLSWRYNGFGFMFLWCRGWYVQIGTVKLMVTKAMEPIEPMKWDWNPIEYGYEEQETDR